MKTSSPRKRLPSKTVVLIVTGSIAAYKAGDLVTRLREEGARVFCVMTESAARFTTPLTLRALSGERVYESRDFFASDSPHSVVHTELAESADALVVAPASADFIARMAAGLTDDLAACILLATRRPILIAPAMNDQMYGHPITQENIKRLRAIGHRFVDPVEGHLVCGREAVGHVADPEAIVTALEKVLKSSSPR